MKRLVPGLLVSVLLLGGPSAMAGDLVSSPWEVSLDGRVGVPGGWVRVRENHIAGDRLRLHRDLGVDVSEAAGARGAYHWTPKDAFYLDLESIFLYGSTTPSHDFLFNAATLAAGHDLRTRPQFQRISLGYERWLAKLGDKGSLSATAGVTYVLLTFKLHGTVAANSVGGETKEDFLSQELPIPIFGLHGDYPLSRRFALVGGVAGGFLPLVDSLRSEGGTVKLSQSHADVDLGVRYSLTSDVELDGGYLFRYFTQHETSREDGNEIHLYENAFGLNLTYHF